MKQEIINILKNTIKDNYNIDVDTTNIKLSNPPKGVLGDFSVNVGFLARDLKKNPKIIAEELVDYIKFIPPEKGAKGFKGLKPSVDIIKETSALNGFLNIKINKNIFTKQFLEYVERSESGGTQGSPLQEEKKGTIIIDYIGANVGKPMHIGHMCTPNQGQVMINIYKKLGYNVISDSHIGDWGIIFGKLILAFKKWGDKEKLKQNAVEHLLELYVKITEETEKNSKLEEEIRNEFKKLSSGDSESIEYWAEFTSESIKAMNILLGRMNVKADFNIGESFYEGLGLPKMEDYPDLKCDMKCVVNELLENKIAIKNEDNSVGVNFPEETKIPSCILQKRDGTHGYLASDLAAVKYRVDNWNPEKIIYFVDARQQLHLKQVFEISDNVGWIKKEKLFHAYNGFISLKDGAMSTRKGRIIKLESLLDEAEERAKKIILEKRDDIDGEELENLAKIIGIGAIKYGYLKKNRESDIIFDWDEFMSFEGNSGPYIQYAYVRARRILEKENHKIEQIEKQSGQTHRSAPTENNVVVNLCVHPEDSVFLDKHEEIELIKKILEYKNILIETTKNNYPHILANYTYELTKFFNSFYNSVHILNEEDEDLKNLRLILILEFTKILKEAFELLGIEMPERM